MINWFITGSNSKVWIWPENAILNALLKYILKYVSKNYFYFYMFGGGGGTGANWGGGGDAGWPPLSSRGQQRLQPAHGGHSVRPLPPSGEPSKSERKWGSAGEEKLLLGKLGVLPGDVLRQHPIARLWRSLRQIPWNLRLNNCTEWRNPPTTHWSAYSG